MSLNPLSRLIVASAALLSAGSLAVPAQGALIAVNDANFAASSDGFNITRDTASGLDWLDASITDTMKFVDVDAGPLTPEWRRATLADVETLWDSAGLRHPVTNALLTDFAVNLGNPSSLTAEGVTDQQFRDIFAKADALIQMLGITGGNNANAFRTIGTTADPDPISPAANAIAMIDVLYSPFVQTPPGGCLGVISGTGSGIGDNGGRGDTGHFLVRNTPTAGIPEPATLALLGLGLAVIGAVARRR